MANSHESDPAPPLPDLPDLPGGDRDGAATSGPGSSSGHLPEVHGLTPPGQPVSLSGISAEFNAPGGDLSVAVAMPTESTATASGAPPPAAPPVAEPAAPGTQRLTAGRTFGGYELVAKIGQGGMGEVYRARQVSLDRVVAIKILSKALYDNEEFIKRFEREAKAIARITHPNIVGVYDFGVSDGLRYMVNEFVDGKSLASLISDRLVIPPAEILPLMVQCLAGLAHVGAHGIVHRDIKPDNILITKDWVAKIADFGLAKDVTAKGEHTDLTAVGLAMGTPAYMSPEQCMGQKLDARSDIYALGITAYFAVTGQKPFTGNSSFEIMTKQREHTPPAPHEVAPQVPHELSLIIMKMMAKRPDERYPDPETCRQAWVAVGVLIGAFGRGSEYDTAIPRGSAEMPALVALPPPPLPAAQAAAAAPAPPSSENAPTRSPSSASIVARPARPAATADPTHTASERVARSASERSTRKPSDTQTCPACGQLNRPDATVCTRCSTVLRSGGDPASLVAQEAEAQRLFDSKRHTEAASIWARLADREPDKRARSVLRSKEREARKQEHDQRVGDLRTRANAAIARGDLRGALAMLEQGRELHRDSTASTTSSSVSDVQLERDIAQLRQRLAGRRRSVQIGLALIGLLLAGIVVAIALSRGWIGASTPPPAPPPIPAPPPAGSTP